ncbi:MAG: stalk domain-containing protein [Clostridiales bacterium]
MKKTLSQTRILPYVLASGLLLSSLAIAPASLAAAAPSTYTSTFMLTKASTSAVSTVTPDSEGIEFEVLLVSENDSALSGSIYVASSRSIDSFFFQNAAGAWIPVGSDGEIPLNQVVADSKAGAEGTLARTLHFTMKAVSTVAGNPEFALGLHPDCTKAFVRQTSFPDGCDLSHIIQQTTIGSPSAEEDSKTKIQLAVSGSVQNLPANGAAAYTVVAYATDSGSGANLSGKNIYFSITGGEGASLSATTATTDSEGKAQVSISATKAGSYTLEARDNDSSAPKAFLTLNFTAPSPKLVFTVDSPFYTVDGELLSAIAPAFLEKDRVFLSVRDMGDALGAEIIWDQDSQTATLKKEDITLQIAVGAENLSLSKAGIHYEVLTDAPALNKEGRIYLPFRAVLEAFDYQVNYDQNKQEITCL